jgi:hypothetical protein
MNKPPITYFEVLNELDKNQQKKNAAQADVADWLVGKSDDYTHEVTLTFPFEPKNMAQAEKFFGTFIKYLNNRCFRTRSKANPDKRIKIAATLEGEVSSKKLHYHCSVRKPDHMLYPQFASLVEKTWKRVVGRDYVQIKIKPYTDSGWLRYSTKEISALHTSAVSEHCSF